MVTVESQPGRTQFRVALPAEAVIWADTDEQGEPDGAVVGPVAE
jgi:hypothetical protein